MRATVPARRSPLKVVTFFIVALLIGTVLTIGTLAALGVDLPFLSSKQAAAAPRPERKGTRVFLLRRAVPAYTKLSRDDFFDPKTGEGVVAHRPPEDVQRLGLIADVTQLMNRVLIQDMPPGYALRERDLYPKGTRPGLVAAVPPGKRALVVQADKIHGIHGLKAGDHFDLLGSMPVDMDKVMAKFKNSGMTDPALAQGVIASSKRANVKPLVQNGAVVMPVAIREIPTGTTKGKDGKVPSKPVEEVTIAVDPDEVAPLHEALAIQATIMCVARSGQPDETKSTKNTPGSTPGPSVRTMETIQGGKRQVLIFPGPGQAPQPKESANPTDD